MLDTPEIMRDATGNTDIQEDLVVSQETKYYNILTIL